MNFIYVTLLLVVDLLKAYSSHVVLAYIAGGLAIPDADSKGKRNNQCQPADGPTLPRLPRAATGRVTSSILDTSRK